MSSITDLFSALQNGVKAINSLTIQMKNVFPQAAAISSTVTTGGVTFTSSQATAFLTVQTSSGGIYKVPLYLS